MSLPNDVLQVNPRAVEAYKGLEAGGQQLSVDPTYVRSWKQPPAWEVVEKLAALPRGHGALKKHVRRS
jgi:hypothetical protein